MKSKPQNSNSVNDAKANRRKLERKLGRIIQKYVPEAKDYMACLLMKQGAGFLNSNVPRSVFDSSRMLYLMMKWCKEQSDALYQHTSAPLYDVIKNETDNNMIHLKQLIAAIKGIEKDEG